MLLPNSPRCPGVKNQLKVADFLNEKSLFELGPDHKITGEFLKIPVTKLRRRVPCFMIHGVVCLVSDPESS